MVDISEATNGGSRMIVVESTNEFLRWFERLKDRGARWRIQARIDRLEAGNPGQHRVLKGGVSEMKIDYGPGYRVYYTQRGALLGHSVVRRRQGQPAAEYPGRHHIGQTAWEVSMSIETTRWDSARYLESEEDVAGYLEAVMEEGADDPAYIAHALGVVARARNMSQLARETGMTREGLYKALSGEGNPSFATVSKVARALGLRLSFQPARPSTKTRKTARSRKSA